jgi:hypothetical protein
MKITTEHYDILRSAIMQAQQDYHTLEEYQAHNLTAKRWRYDLLWRAIRYQLLPDHFVTDTLYRYVDDSHIDTALRKITATS